MVKGNEKSWAACGPSGQGKPGSDDVAQKERGAYESRYYACEERAY